MDAYTTQLLMREISALAATTIGKRNKQHIMMKSMDSVTITTSSKYYMEQLCLQYNHNPVMKIFLQVLSTHHKTQGDAGWLCIILATHLLSVSSKRDIPVHALIRGLNLACQLAVEELHSTLTPVALTLDWGEPTQVMCLLMSLFRPHQSTTHLSEASMEILAKTLLGAFISSLSDGSSGSLSPHVVFHSSSLTLALPDQACCQHLEGSLLMDIPLPRAFPYKGARDVLVVVFEQSLELPVQLANISIEGHTTASAASRGTQAIGSVKELEYAYLEDMCDILVRFNIGLVCCQRRIHPHLQRLLSLKGIVCLPRLSIRYINAMLRLSGAKQLGAFPQLQTLQATQSTTSMPLSVSSFGFLHRIYIRYIGEKPYIAIQQSRLYDQDTAEQEEEEEEEEEDGDEETTVLTRLLRDERVAQEILSRRVKFSTLILVGVHANHCREIEYMCTASCKILTQLINDATATATVLPGGGCWQAYIATHVRGKLQLLKEEEDHRLGVTKLWGSKGVEGSDKNCGEDIDIDDPEGIFLSVTPPPPSRDILRAALLFCEAMEHAAMLVGGSMTNRVELESFLQTRQTTPVVTSSVPWAAQGWGGFSWGSSPLSVPPSSSSSSCTSASTSYRFTNATDCVVEVEIATGKEAVREGERGGVESKATACSTRIQSADVLDALLPCVSALQVAVEAVTSIIDIDGIVE